MSNLNKKMINVNKSFTATASPIIIKKENIIKSPKFKFENKTFFKNKDCTSSVSSDEETSFRVTKIQGSKLDLKLKIKTSD